MQRSRSGDRQPQRGGGADLGKEIMKAEQYLTMGKVMELMREALRINITNESRASGNRSTLLPAHEVECLPKCPASPELDATRDLRSCGLFEGDLKKPTKHLAIFKMWFLSSLKSILNKLKILCESQLYRLFKAMTIIPPMRMKCSLCCTWKRIWYNLFFCLAWLWHSFLKL